MISASELNGLLVVLKTHGAGVLRYKSGTGDSGEEIEIIIPSNSDQEDKDMKDKEVSDRPKLRLIGFQGDIPGRDNED